MPSSLRIDAYADIACPWCYIGRRRLQAALAQRPALDATLRWRPFQLQPNLPPEGRDWRAFAEAKFGSWERAQQMFAHVQQASASDDLTFDFEAMAVAPNTADAHRLVLWAQDEGAGGAMAETLFRAYFTEGRNVSDAAVLAACAAEAGLDADAARSVLAGDAYADAVRESQAQAREHGVRGVPFYRLGGRTTIAGAQPVDTMVGALDRAVEGAPEA